MNSMAIAQRFGWKSKYAAHIDLEYAYFTERGTRNKNISAVPHMGEMFNEINYSILLTAMELEVDAMVRDDKHKELGLDRQAFEDMAMEGKVTGAYGNMINMQDFLPNQNIILVDTYFHLERNDMAYIDFDGELKSAPIGGVW